MISRSEKSEATMRWAAFLLLCWVPFVVSAEDGPALVLKQSIPLPGVRGRFDHFSIDTKGQRLFVAALGNDSLEVIDLAAGKRLQSVSGMSKPTGVLYLPDANKILVANGSDGTLKFVNGTSF